MRYIIIILFSLIVNYSYGQTDSNKIDIDSIKSWVNEYECTKTDPIGRAIVFMKADMGFNDALIECSIALVGNDHDPVRDRAFQILYLLYKMDPNGFITKVYSDPIISELIDPDEVFDYFNKKIKIR